MRLWRQTARNRGTPLAAAFGLALGFFIVAMVGLLYMSYATTKASILSGIDKQLLAGAAGLEFTLAPDFHDRASGPGAVSVSEDERNIAALTSFADAAGFKFLYTLVERDEQLYITSSSATAKELASGHQVRYFTAFDEAASDFLVAIRQARVTSFTHSDRWGTFRAVALPRTSPDGRPYLSVAELDISSLKGMLTAQILQTLMEVALFILGLLPLLWLAVVRERRNAAEKQTMAAQLQQSAKMESVGLLAGGVAHDYNNMLSIVIGFTELARDKVTHGDPLHGDLDEIMTAAKRSADITRQLLTFARKQTIEPDVLDLNRNVESMLKMLRRLIGEDIELGLQHQDDLWPVLIDPSQVDQVLANLCINARDAIRDVGMITIVTENVTFDESDVAGRDDFTAGDYVLLAVTDDGCGITPEHLERIFEPFFTTKELGQGTGLGLATVHGIVLQNDGRLEVRSQPGKGTTFLIYLPRYEGSSVGTTRGVTTATGVGHGETILLVDDDRAILKVGQTLLEGLGYRVLPAASAAEALRRAAANGESPDLLLTDVVMPGLNGRDLHDRLLVDHPDLPVLYMSGYPAEVIAERGILAEGVSFISKPFSRQGLAAKVHEVLASCPSSKPDPVPTV